MKRDYFPESDLWTIILQMISVSHISKKPRADYLEMPTWFSIQAYSKAWSLN
jgi:hypothetical protein